jgi:hypothetical protein
MTRHLQSFLEELLGRSRVALAENQESDRGACGIDGTIQVPPPPTLGFKRFGNAVITISGIELAEKIKKGQFKTGKLGGCNATMTALWNEALAA